MSLHQAIQSFLSSDHYNACFLIVNPNPAALADIAVDLQRGYDWSLLNIGEQLSKELLFVSPRNQSRHTKRWLQDILNNIESELIICTNISLLFEPSLKLDPFHLFRQMGRRKKLIVMWPGRYKNDTLSYAQPEHAHYATWQNPEVDIWCPE